MQTLSILNMTLSGRKRPCPRFPDEGTRMHQVSEWQSWDTNQTHPKLFIIGLYQVIRPEKERNKHRAVGIQRRE